MATNFPTSLDTWPTLRDNQTTIMASYINNIQDAVEALEAKVGIDSSAVAASLDRKIRNFWDRYTPRKIYLYEDSAPTRWSTVASVGDKVLAIKGGSKYSTGGTTAGDGWTITGWGSTGHTHPFWWYSAGYTWTYNSVGGTLSMGNATYVGEERGGLQVGMSIDGWPDSSYQYFEIGKVATGTHAYVKAESHTHTHAGTWRPKGAIGILIKCDG